MPELPEVYSIQKQLNQFLSKFPNTVLEVMENNKKLRYYCDLNVIKNKTLIKVDRIGKYLIFLFADHHPLISHLGMTGGFVICFKNAPWPEKLSKHWIFALVFEDYFLIYRDIRRFGSISFNQPLVHSLDILNYKFDLSFFQKIIHKYHSRNLKVFLMEQNHMAGIGNIYASEILAYAKLWPERLVQSLNDVEIQGLYISILRTLYLAIAHSGSCINDYHLPDSHFSNGSSGKYQNHFYVYQQKKCIHQHLLSKWPIAGRSTYACAICCGC